MILSSRMSTLATDNSTLAQGQPVAVEVAAAPSAGIKTGGGPSQRGRDFRQLGRLFESLPPHAIEAEMSLLGSILLDPQVLGDLSKLPMTPLGVGF